MDLGVSVYIDSDYSIEGNIDYISRAKAHGCNYVFTSLHLPEVDYTNTLREFEKMNKYISKQNMKIIVDIAPRTMELLGATPENLKPFKDLNIDVLRVDYGFSTDDIITMGNNEFGINIQLNASTIDHEHLKTIYKGIKNPKKISASHNFFPRVHTGLSEIFFAKQNEMIKLFSLPIFVFIPLLTQQRGPIYEGLPTIESHRNKSVRQCVNHIIALENIDGIIVGDAYADDNDLRDLALSKENIMRIKIELLSCVSPEEKDLIFLPYHQTRDDLSAQVLRSKSTRKYAQKGQSISPNIIKKRNAYDITIDNERFKRYSGELQIILEDLASDYRTNVVGRISEVDKFLIKSIKTNQKFKFIE